MTEKNDLSIVQKNKKTWIFLCNKMIYYWITLLQKRTEFFNMFRKAEESEDVEK